MWVWSVVIITSCIPFPLPATPVGAIQFRTDEGVWLNSPVTVGNGSDVLIQVTCSDSDIGGNWSFSNGTTVPDPLTAFGISQDPVGGVLRIYPAPLIEREGLETYMCNVNETQETLTFLLRKNPPLY